MSEKSKLCQYRKSKFMAGTIAALAFSIATNSSAFAADITITDLADLAQISEDISNSTDFDNTYFLGSNLDLADVAVSGPTFTYVVGQFTGIFNGGGYTISNLRAPLFDVIGDGSGNGSVSNLGLKTNSEGITGDASLNRVGVLAGILRAGSGINGVAVSGSITTVAEDVAGGLVGIAEAGTLIANSSSNVSITAVSGESAVLGVVGGLVGHEYGGIITNSSSTGTILSTDTETNAGGLVGRTEYGSQIINSTSSSQVTVGQINNELSNVFAGGLVGYAEGTTITNSSSSGAVTNVRGLGSTGGLVGFTANGQVSQSTASGAVKTSNSFTGGLIGEADNLIVSESSASGAVMVTESQDDIEFVGGLLGFASTTDVSNSSASGDVTVISDGSIAYVGGLVGSGYGVTNSLASGSIRVTSNGSYVRYIGGLGGSNYSIDNSAAIGNVNVSAISDSSIDYVGGLVGAGYGVANSLASGDVSVISDGSIANVGGLLGAGYFVANSLASGDVSVISDGSIANVGGLVGRGYIDVVNSLASGDVSVYTTSSAANFVGTLAGQVGNLSNSYSTGELNFSANGTIDGYLGEDASIAMNDSSYLNLIDTVGPNPDPGNSINFPSDVDLLNTELNPSSWGQNQYINNGLPFILALRGSGFYAESFPQNNSIIEREIDSDYYLMRVFRYLAGENQIKISVADFNFLGINGVNEANLPIVLDLLKSTEQNTVNLKTIKEYIRQADLLLKKRIRLFSYLAGDSSLKIGIADFTEIGVYRVTNVNLPYVLKLLKGEEWESLNLKAISKIVRKADLALKMTSRSLNKNDNK